MKKSALINKGETGNNTRVAQKEKDDSYTYRDTQIMIYDV